MRSLQIAALCGIISFALTSFVSAASPVFNWTGFYVGGNVGYSWGRSNTDYTVTGGSGTVVRSDSSNVNGAIGGIQAGFNYQFAPMWVAGVEADWQASGQKGSGVLGLCVNAPCDTDFVNGAHDEKLQWFSTMRGRVGYLVTPTWLVYATGGVAFGRLTRDDTITDVTSGAVATASLSGTNAGPAVGAGFETALWGNFSGRVEYLYISLPSVGSYHVVSGQADVVTNTGRFTDNILRVGLNYRFGP